MIYVANVFECIDFYRLPLRLPMMCAKYRKDLLYGPVAHNIRKMKRVKYLQDRLALRPFRIHVNLDIVKNFFTIRDARVKYCQDLP